MRLLETNVGKLDQFLRVFVGIVLLFLFAGHVIGPWGLIGFVPLVTGLLRSCPLYRLLGIRTCDVQQQP